VNVKEDPLTLPAREADAAHGLPERFTLPVTLVPLCESTALPLAPSPGNVVDVPANCQFPLRLTAVEELEDEDPPQPKSAPQSMSAATTCILISWFLLGEGSWNDGIFGIKKGIRLSFATRIRITSKLARA